MRLKVEGWRREWFVWERCTIGGLIWWTKAAGPFTTKKLAQVEMRKIEEGKK